MIKKYIYLTLLFIIIAATSSAQLVQKANKMHVGTTNATMHASAALDVTSTTKGFLPPRMTEAQRNAITTPARGLIVYCTDCAKEGLYVYNGSGFVPLAGAVDGATNGITSTGNNVKLGGTLIENTLITQGANTLDFTTTAVDGFAVDGTTFSVDGSNDRVGVGTALPEAKLEVNGAVKIGNNTGNAVVGMIRYNGTNYQGCTVAGNPGTWVDLDTSTSNSVTPITSITAATTLDTTHSTVIINTGSPVITLPTASANVGRIYRIVNRTTNTGTISTYRTITDASAISTTYVPNKVLLLQSDGTDWFQIN